MPDAPQPPTELGPRVSPGRPGEERKRVWPKKGQEQAPEQEPVRSGGPPTRVRRGDVRLPRPGQHEEEPERAIEGATEELPPETSS